MYYFIKQNITRNTKNNTICDINSSVASIIKHEIGKHKEPLTDRQKQIIERVRNGTDFDVYSSQKFLELLS